VERSSHPLALGLRPEWNFVLVECSFRNCSPIRFLNSNKVAKRRSLRGGEGS
jgi:hypothetical protein